MVATCIILHKNWVVASGVGAVVAAYISFTEYYLANNDIRNIVMSMGTLKLIFTNTSGDGYLILHLQRVSEAPGLIAFH